MNILFAHHRIIKIILLYFILLNFIKNTERKTLIFIALNINQFAIC